MAGANILHLPVSSEPVLESRPHSRASRPFWPDRHLAPSKPEAAAVDDGGGGGGGEVNRSRPPALASKEDFLVINNLQQCVIFLASKLNSHSDT